MSMKFALLAFSLTLAAGAVAAQPAAPVGPMSLAQFQTLQRTRMLAADANKDGKLSKDEMKAMAKARGGGSGMQIDLFWGMIDTDHDGFLTKTETDKLSAQRFKRLDTDHDGSLSTAELAAARQQRAAR